MHAQITLTVPVAKRIIAEAIFLMPLVQNALAHGKIVLKGGTTVSLIAERMLQTPLRISGRISSNGAKTAFNKNSLPHSMLIQNGKAQSIDDCFCDTISTLSKDDIVIIGANALDIHGQAAIMLGSPLGGENGKGLAGLMAQGCRVIIACGLEKLIPTTLAYFLSLNQALSLLKVYFKII